MNQLLRDKELKPKKAAAAFTMVEIALSLAVVAFALVAIIGVLPTGMTVQKDNREDTLMAQEGRYWLEAIRTGAKGLDHLTNYVEQITITNEAGIVADILNKSDTPLLPDLIITLLNTPKYELGPNGVLTNRVSARVRPITGNAADLAANTTNTSVGFRYQLQVEFTDTDMLPQEALGLMNAADTNQAIRLASQMRSSLHDVRIILRYPLVERGTNWVAGSGRKTLRAQIAGARVNGTIEANTFARVIP